MDYEEGFDIINWAKMNERNYSDVLSKSVCMAECLSPAVVSPESIHSLYVVDEEIKNKVNQIVSNMSRKPYINVCPGMFVAKP